MHPEPLSPVEQDILQIWQDVLGISDIGPQNNFFELGGNSIHCMRVLVRIRELFGLDIDIQSVFMNATIAQQAQMIIETAAEGACA